MANYGNYDLPLFEDDIQAIKEFFKIALNTIFFHRWLGETKFEDVDSVYPNLTYVKVNNDNLQKSIDYNVSQLEKNILKSKRALVTLNFYQKKISKFYIRQELCGLWESWKFYFELKKDSDLSSNLKENKIRERIFNILKNLNDKFDFMPDFNADTKLPEETFPYEITINTNVSENDFVSLIKEMGINNALNL